MNEAKNKIAINGRSLPVRVTMGALLRFKRATGKEISQIKDDMDDALTFMHCCVSSACKADGIPFDLDMETMADHLTADDVSGFTGVFRSWHRTHVEQPWEQTRLVACCLLQPWSKKKLRPEDVMRFEWDKKRTAHANPVVAQSTRQRFEEIRRRCGC